MWEGRSASHAHRASRTSTGRSNAFSREISQASPRIVLPRPVEVRLARCAWEADRPPTRPLTSDSQTDLWGRSVRPWEASDSQTDHMTLWWARPLTHTASQIWESDRPLTHTGRCCHPRARLTDFMAKRIASAGRVRSDSDGLSRTRPHRFESPIGLSRIPGDAVILGAVWLISRLNALHRPVCVRGRSDSQICERPCSLIGSDRSHDKFCEAEAMRGRERPWEAKSERPWEAVRGREALIGLEICVRESQIYLSQSGPHGLSRPLTASHGLSRPHKFHWKCLKI